MSRIRTALRGFVRLTALSLLIAGSTGTGVAAATPAAEAEAEERAPARIAATTTPAQDAAIRARLEGIFSQLDGADGIRVSVQSGVVTLSGELLSPGAREQAERLARNVDGVVEVNDQTLLTRDIDRQLAPAFDRLAGIAADAMGYLPVLALALLLFALFWFAAFLLGRWERLFLRITPNPFLADFIRQFAKFAVLVLGLLLAFELLDATALIGTVLGAAGLLGLALGIALRDTVENYIAGILLSLKQPFVHDDWVAIEGHEGRVLRLTSRATLLMTLDGNHVRIPNATVFNGILVNYTRNPVRRFQFDAGVSSSTSLSAAQQLAAETLRAMEGVIADPPPRVDVFALGDSNVVLRAQAWVDQRQVDFGKVRSEGIRLVKEAFDQAGVAMPEPTYTIRQEQAPRTPPPAGPRQAIDVRPQRDLERQIERDRRDSGEDDLLRADAPQE